MPATVRPPPDEPRPAIAAAASPYGLRLRDDRRIPKPQPNRVRPMSRLMRDISPETYVVNPDTSLSVLRPIWAVFLSPWGSSRLSGGSTRVSRRLAHQSGLRPLWRSLGGLRDRRARPGCPASGDRYGRATQADPGQCGPARAASCSLCSERPTVNGRAPYPRIGRKSLAPSRCPLGVSSRSAAVIPLAPALLTRPGSA